MVWPQYRYKRWIRLQLCQSARVYLRETGFSTSPVVSTSPVLSTDQYKEVRSVKYLLLAVVVLLVYLFYPTYDLYIKENPFAEQYVLVKKGFYSKSRCSDHVEGLAESALDIPEHRCRKTSKWGQMYGSYTRYDPAIREAQKDHQTDY